MLAAASAVTSAGGGVGGGAGSLGEQFGLSSKMRYLVFGGCFLVGAILAIISTWLADKLAIFFILYLIGIILLLLSTMIMWGPVEQMKTCFSEEKRYATIAFVICFILVIVFGVIKFKGHTAVAFLVALVQLIAIGWYVICSVPGGFTAVKALIKF